MRKSDKKVENQLIISLTEVCETSLKNYTGFQWLTHLVNYNNFPLSLQIVCVFDTNDNLSNFMQSSECCEFNHLIQTKLFEIDINLKNITNHISYDTEENCKKDNKGKWADRLQ
jgi:hypothetical protein